MLSGIDEDEHDELPDLLPPPVMEQVKKEAVPLPLQVKIEADLPAVKEEFIDLCVSKITVYLYCIEYTSLSI